MSRLEDLMELRQLQQQFIADCRGRDLIITLDSLISCDECEREKPLRKLRPFYDDHYGCIFMACVGGCTSLGWEE